MSTSKLKLSICNSTFFVPGRFVLALLNKILTPPVAFLAS